MQKTTSDMKSRRQPNKVLAILGMHRSGTSCLTGSLQEAGLSLGECHTWNPHNLKGNRENQQFVDLHEDILQANGGAWDEPPKHCIWREEDVARAAQLLEDHADEPFFGFKDPRTLLVIDGWKRLCPQVKFVGIYRHPEAVVRSLEKRSGKLREDSLKLWYAYNSRLMQEYKKKPFPMLCFDDEESVLDEKIFQVADQLGLAGRPDDTKFFTPELKSTVEEEGLPLPWNIRRLLKKLSRVAL